MVMSRHLGEFPISDKKITFSEGMRRMNGSDVKAKVAAAQTRTLTLVPPLREELIPLKEVSRRLGCCLATTRRLAAVLQWTRYGQGKRLLRFDWVEILEKIRIKE